MMPNLRAVSKLLMVAGLATPGFLSAQAPDPPPEEWDSISDALRGHEWADQINNLLDIAQVMPDSLYSFSPVDPLMTFGEVIGHIADIQFYFCDTISNRSGPERSSVTDADGKEAIIGFLMEAITACDEMFDNLSDEQLVANHAKVADNITTKMGHTRRETGRLATYLRLVGVTPPEIKFYQGRTWRNESDER